MMLSSESIETEAVPVQVARTRRRFGRLPILLVAGVLLVGGAYALRTTPWARELELRRLSTRSLEYAVLEHPNDPAVLRALGAALSQDGDHAGSAIAYRRAADVDPKNYDTQMALGAASAAADQPHEAERAWVEAARLRPRDPAPHFLLAQLYDVYRNKSSTLGPLEKVTELDPKNAEAWYRYGVALEELHQFDRALPALQKAVALAPDRPLYLRDLAQIQMHFGKREEAKSSLTRAAAMEDRDPGTLVLLAKIDLDAGASGPALKPAEELLQRALKLDGKYAPAHRELGTLYARDSRFTEAVNALRLAVKLDPTDGQALFQLGQALLRTGNTAEGQRYMKGFQALSEARRSVSALEDRIHQEPKNAGLRLRVARLYRRYGAPERAVNQYQVYLSLKRDPAVAKELDGYRTELRTASRP